MTALIKLWRFLEGVSPSREKKVKQKALPYMHQDVTFFEDISLPSMEKRVMQEPLPFYGPSDRVRLELGKCLIKVRIHCLLSLNLAFFTNYAIFLKLCDQMRFEVSCAKSHHRVISDGLH